MAADPEAYGKPIGSGRVRLPARLGKDRISPDFTKFVKKTTTQRNALALGTAGEGSVVYDDTLNKLVLWNGTTWTNLDGTALA